MVILRYNLVETPRKFTVAKLSIRKLGPSSLLALMKIRAYKLQIESFANNKLTCNKFLVRLHGECNKYTC